MAPNDALFVRISAGPRWKMNDPEIRKLELMTVYYDNKHAHFQPFPVLPIGGEIQ